MKKPLMIVGLMLAAGMMAQADKIALPKESPAGTVVVQSPKAHEPQGRQQEAIAKYVAAGAAGEKLPDTFRIHIETDGVSRPVHVYKGWNFTPTAVERLGYVQAGTNWQGSTRGGSESTRSAAG